MAILNSLDPNGTIGRFARDRWLVHALDQAQQEDGFFLFSRGDTTPASLAETYFAVISLHLLGAETPRVTTLRSSLALLEDEAASQIDNGPVLWGSREFYEDIKIHQFIGTPVRPPIRAWFESSLQLSLARLPRPMPGPAVHDWYYGVQALTQLSSVSSQSRASYAADARALLQRPTNPSGRLLVDALAVDTLCALGLSPTASERNDVAASIAGRQRADGAFAFSGRSDILTSFFAVLAADDINDAGLLSVSRSLTWLAGRYAWDGYSVAVGEPVTPLATAYGLMMRRLLEVAAPRDVPR